MRERISQLAKGKFEENPVTASLSLDKIEEQVAAEDKARGDFYISCPDGHTMKGLVYSSNQYVRPLTPHFIGKECRIPYEVDTTQTQGSLSGEFQIVTDHGEYFLPYLFRITNTGQNRTTITLPEFMELVDNREEEALKLFESSRFAKTGFMQEPGLNTVYEGIWGRGNRDNAMEEFLVASGARAAVHISVEEHQKEYPSLNEAVCDDLVITRTGAGFLKLKLEADCPFIRLDKTDLSDADFDGNTCTVMYTILPAKLHSGVNLGRILVKGLYESETIEVRVITNSGRKNADRTAYKKDMIDFTKLYLKLLISDTEKSLLLNSMNTVLNHSRENAPDPNLHLLYQCDVSIRQGRMEQAGELLARAREGILTVRDKRVSSYCYYMWLKAQISKDPQERQNMLKLLRKYYDEGIARDMTFFILMQEDPELQDNDSLTLSRLKEHYRKGSLSPYLFLAGAMLFRKDPYLLRVLDPFEIGCMKFAVRHDMVDKVLAKNMAELCMRVKKQQKPCLWVLKRIYEQEPVKEVLTGICALLIRQDLKNSDAFTWYRLGVREDVRLTRLYEYFLYSLPEKYEEPLPKRLVLYFALNNTLDFRTQAALYSNILKFMKEDEDVLRAYSGQIESFVVEQLFQGRISEKLAEIYSHVLFPEMVDDKIAAVLPKLVFAKKITCSVPGMRQVVLCYEELRGETVATLKNNCAILPVYLEHVHVLFQDSFGSRYANLPYTMEPVMESPELEACIQNRDLMPFAVRIRECLDILKKEKYTAGDIECMKELAQDDEIRPLFRKKLLSEIIAYYYQEEELSACDGFLLTIDKKLLKKEDRLKVLETLISKEFFEEAFKMAGRYGYRRISTASVLKLTSRMIQRRLYAEDPLLLELATYCFEKKQYDEVVTEYLCQHYNGPCRTMYEVLAAGKEKKISLYDLPERLLAQMLFCGNYDHLNEVFACYEAGAGIDEMLVQAYLCVRAKKYFEQDEKKKEDFPKGLELWLMSGIKGTLPEICMLAQTRYYADLNGLSEEQTGLCQTMIDRLLRRKIWFRYYRRLMKYISLPSEFLEDTLVEFHGGEGGHFMIRSLLLPDAAEPVEEVLPHMFGGYYSRRYSLLCGERLQYEIFEQGKPEVTLAGGTAEKTALPYEKSGNASGTRVDMLNDLLKITEEGNEVAWREKATDYIVRDGIAESLFTPLTD